MKSLFCPSRRDGGSSSCLSLFCFVLRKVGKPKLQVEKALSAIVACTRIFREVHVRMKIKVVGR